MIKIELSRRLLLQNAAIAASSVSVLGTLAKSATAQAKSSQQVASYQSEPSAGQRCGTCQQFQPPGACRIVSGRISPQGWCKLYFPKTG
jgi:hypothetical protein